MITTISSQSVTAPQNINQAETSAPTAIVASAELSDQKPSSRPVEERVRSYFADAPILAEVARCESGFTHINSKGDVVRGRVNKNDIGVMQINTGYHGEKAEELGYDIMTLEGNMAFARYLYNKYGTDPWSASAKCWKKTQVAKR